MSAKHDDALALHALLVPLIQFALAEPDDPSPQWRAEAMRTQQDLRGRVGSELPAALDVDSIWVRAVEDAERDDRISGGGGVSLSMPKMLPFERALLLADPFDPDAIRLRIRGAAATG